MIQIVWKMCESDWNCVEMFGIEWKRVKLCESEWNCV